MLHLHELLPTQEVIRDQKQLPGMLCFVRGGGFWTPEAMMEHARMFNRRDPEPIYITRFPDGIKIIHDGHHRIVSTLAGGRDYLRDDEYIIKDWQYSDYNRIKLQGEGLKTPFITPFDPLTEVRVPDLRPFKAAAMKVWDDFNRRGNAELAGKMLSDFVTAQKYQYARPRTMWTVIELMESCVELRGGAAGKILCG